ncbi:hypothetical protein D3C85_91060 [compost metagenome]
MTEAEIRILLEDKFYLWKEQVKRLIDRAAQFAVRAYNTDRVNGYSLADLVAIIRGEVKAHEDVVNAHGDTLALLGGMTKTQYDLQKVNYYPKDAVPVSKVPLVAVTVGAGTLNIPAFTMIYQGRKVNVAAANLTLSTAARQYVTVTISEVAPGRVATLAVTTNVTESQTKIIFGAVNYAGGVWTPAMVKIVRLGMFAVTQTPRGQAIPASTGTQAAPSNINSGWTT